MQKVELDTSCLHIQRRCLVQFNRPSFLGAKSSSKRSVSLAVDQLDDIARPQIELSRPWSERRRHRLNTSSAWRWWCHGWIFIRDVFLVLLVENRCDGSRESIAFDERHEMSTDDSLHEMHHVDQRVFNHVEILQSTQSGSAHDLLATIAELSFVRFLVALPARVSKLGCEALEHRSALLVDGVSQQRRRRISAKMIVAAVALAFELVLALQSRESQHTRHKRREVRIQRIGS